MKRKQFLTTCVASTAEKIDAMVDNAREITYNTFLRHVGAEELKEFNHPSLPLKKDYHVRYFKSKYEGAECVYMVHSAIEYVFV